MTANQGMKRMVGFAFGNRAFSCEIKRRSFV